MKYTIESKPYYCYTIEDNKVIAVLLDDRNEYGQLIELKENQINLYKGILEIMEQDMEACISLKDTLYKELEVTVDQYNNLSEKYNELEKTNRVLKGVTAVAVPLAIIVLILLAL